MRKFLPLLVMLLSVSAFSQMKKDASPGTAEFLDQKFWSELGKPTEGPRGYSLYTRNMQPKSDTLFELWVKIMPTNAAMFNRRYSLPRESAYVIQFATVDCGKRLVVMERTSAYNDSNIPLDPRGSDLVKNESRARVRTGSVSETVFEYLCLKLQ